MHLASLALSNAWECQGNSLYEDVPGDRNHGGEVFGKVNKDTAPSHISWAKKKDRQKHEEHQWACSSVPFLFKEIENSIPSG